jgi:anti-anti-sigma factor
MGFLLRRSFDNLVLLKGAFHACQTEPESRSRKKRFVIDLKGVERMTSVGLGALVSAYTSTKKTDGKVVLASVTNIENLLNITQLVRVFEICDSRAEAIQATLKE